MGFWARSWVEVARRVLCTGEVPGVAFEVEVPDDFLCACLGVLGLLGTEATSDGEEARNQVRALGKCPLRWHRDQGEDGL